MVELQYKLVTEELGISHLLWALQVSEFVQFKMMLSSDIIKGDRVLFSKNFLLD